MRSVANSLRVGLLKHAVKLVELSVGRFAGEGGAVVGQQRYVMQARGVRVRLPDFQVRLPVQVRRLDKRYTLRFTATHDASTWSFITMANPILKRGDYGKVSFS